MKRTLTLLLILSISLFALTTAAETTTDIFFDKVSEWAAQDKDTAILDLALTTIAKNFDYHSTSFSNIGDAIIPIYYNFIHIYFRKPDGTLPGHYSVTINYQMMYVEFVTKDKAVYEETLLMLSSLNYPNGDNDYQITVTEYDW